MPCVYSLCGLFVFSFRLSIIWRWRHSWRWTTSKWSQRVLATVHLLSVGCCLSLLTCLDKWDIYVYESLICDCEQRRRAFLWQKFLFKESVLTYRKSNGTTVARQQGLGGVELGCSQGSVSEPPWVSPWWFGIPMLRLETWATDKDKLRVLRLRKLAHTSTSFGFCFLTRVCLCQCTCI